MSSVFRCTRPAADPAALASLAQELVYPPCLPSSTSHTSRVHSKSATVRRHAPQRPGKRQRLDRKMLTCFASAAEDTAAQRKVVVLGGTGRVGSSTAVSLLKKDPSLQVVVASRSKDTYNQAVKKRPQLSRAQFVQVRPIESTDATRICLSRCF